MTGKELSIEQYGNTDTEQVSLVPYDEQQFKVTTIGETRQDLMQTFYQGASNLLITPEEESKLTEPVKYELVEIRPDGLIYYPQVFFRDMLNTTFGRGQWALVQHAITQVGNKLCYDGSLYIRGCFVARAIGEHEYKENNPLGSWASSYESAKSDCLTRCCKDLGIAKELWQPQYVREWIKNNAVRVWVKQNYGDAKVRFRKKDAEPLQGETGLYTDKKDETKPTQHPKPEPVKAAPVVESITENQLIAINTAGSKKYGTNWDAKRKELVKAVSKGRTESSKELTKHEAGLIIDGFTKH